MAHIDVNRKEEFKQRFREFDDEELIENSFRPLTEEALEATNEILQERGLAGEALQLKISATKKEIVSRSGVTNQCDFCGKSLSFGFFRSGRQRFCTERCRTESALLVKSIDLAPDLIYEHAISMKFGECPKCGVVGNNMEMWPSYHVIGALVYTHYARTIELCCFTCARKTNLQAAAICLVLGWWSLAGLFSTPVLIFRNLRAAFAKPADSDPSYELLLRARIDLAKRIPDFVFDKSDLQGKKAKG